MFGINKDLNIHFIGIGGIGMSGIAHILLNLGYKVSGSDINESATVFELKNKGAHVFIGHDEKNIKDVQLIVYSSAIDDKNPEIKKAISLKIPIVKRAEMLAELMRLKFGIAVAGSHGKTTTTSLLSTIFKKNGLNPTCVVGGIVKNLESQAISGDSMYIIAEADESDGSFLYLNPIMSVITNIDNDHMDFYKSEDAIFDAFNTFANKIPFYGNVAINLDDPKSRELIKCIKRPYITYALDREADYQAEDIKVTDQGCTFTCKTSDGNYEVQLKIAGRYNVSNALAAIAIANKAGIDMDKCCSGIAAFNGVGRRFEYLKNDSDLVVIDDYAHHPTEIENILEIFVEKYQNYKKICIFQPHRYSRTKQFWNEFCANFDSADEVYVLPIYAASEEPIEYIDSEVMVKNIKERGVHASYLENWADLESLIKNNLGKNAAIITLGAGSISRETRKIIETI